MYTFDAKVWIWSNNTKPGSRYFVTIPPDIAEKIRHDTKDMTRKGRGSIVVKPRISYIQRQTSIFPDSTSNSYLLPLKAQIRKELMIDVGMIVTVDLAIVDI